MVPRWYQVGFYFGRNCSMMHVRPDLLTRYLLKPGCSPWDLRSPKAGAFSVSAPASFSVRPAGPAESGKSLLRRRQRPGMAPENVMMEACELSSRRRGATRDYNALPKPGIAGY